MIKIENLVKKYNNIKALDGLNLEIRDGEIFGLIGHNGAGKSTTIKSIVSIIKPTEGKIYVNGMDLEEHRDEIKKMTGYVSDTPDMFLRLTAGSFWRFIADVYKVSPEVREERLKYLTKVFEMEGKNSIMLEEFSHGMRQKAFIIAALISDPKIWILDEPLTGLDPQSAYNLKELMKEHAKSGNTVLFSTHVLETAESLCDRVGILSKGKLIFSGTVEELKELHPGETLEKIYLEMVSDKNESVDFKGLEMTAEKKDEII